MRKTRRTETTLEMREVLIVRARPGASEPCPNCLPAAGALVSPDLAAALTGTSVRAVFQCLEADLIHYREAEDGRVLVCLGSLAARVGSPALRLADETSTPNSAQTPKGIQPDSEKDSPSEEVI